MTNNYTFMVIKKEIDEIAYGNAFDNKYLTFDLNGTDGYIEMEYSNYIEDNFPSEIDNEIDEISTIIEESMNEDCWVHIDSRELLSAFIIDFFRNTFNLDIESDLYVLKSEMFNKMFEDLGYPNEYGQDDYYAWKID